MNKRQYRPALLQLRVGQGVTTPEGRTAVERRGRSGVNLPKD